MTDFNETIVARLTAPGEGAVSIARLSGEKSISIVNKVFKGTNLENVESHTVHYGYIIDGTKTIDEVLVTIFRSPKSFTTEDSVEISCHGSEYILQKVIELLLNNGAKMAKPGEFTLRAFLNGRIDLSQAEAVADLISSSGSKSHEQAMRQMRGGFSLEIGMLREKLIEFASLIELELDFGEEDVEFANREQLRSLLDELYRKILSLKESFKYGNVMKNGVNTVIAGRPNAGKSTLLNALLNEERAIVSEIAGTTRDTIEEVLNIHGVSFRLIDTAGIREAHDTIEAMGVEKTMEKISTAALQIYVFDQNELTEEEIQKDITLFREANVPIILIANKSDLSKTEFKLEGDFGIVSLSAKKKTNISELKQLMFDLVLGGKIDADQTIITNLRHFEALSNAQESLEDVLNGMNNGLPSDLIAFDIKHVLHHLGTITGAISTDDLLESIFSNFCIGK